MKALLLIFLLIPFSGFPQEAVETIFIDDTELNAETLINIDNFNTVYYVKNNVFYKKDLVKTISYNNLQLGDITSVDAFNPLKINLFYKDFNTAVILDNRLAEIFKIDFNTKQPYRNVSHVSTGNDNTLWLFNQDSKQLELYDYKNNTTRAKTLPTKGNVLDIKSNYNYCWLLTTDYLLTYNYFGTQISKIKNEGFASIDESNENIILKKDGSLFYSRKGSDKIVPIKTPNLLINQFLVTNETLYIYNHGVLKKFQLKTN